MSQQQFPSLSLSSTPSAHGVDAKLKSPYVKAYELKGFMFSVLTMCLKQIDMVAIEEQLTNELSKLPDFSGEPMVLDLQNVSNIEEAPDFSKLIEVIYKYKLTPIGICNGNELQRSKALSLGIPILEGGAASNKKRVAEASKEDRTKQNESEAKPLQDAAPEVVPATHIISTPVRTGQRIFSKGDVTILAGVNPGAEVLAMGSIHVYGPLRGRALAGVGGDTNARIFTKSMQAELVSIAGSFRVLENELEPDVQGKPAQIYLEDERVIIKPL